VTIARGVAARDALDSARVAIGASGSDTPRLDAELLLAHALGVERMALVLDPQLEVSGAATRTFRELVRRRSVGREPVAYLIGRRGFRHLELDVDARVLVPRPETEDLVELGLTLPTGARVVDVGTGSGAIALALKHERPDLRVTATDISEDALAVARANAARLGLEVAFRRADLLDGIDDVDAVLSNPPYVATGDEVAPEVDHEPRLALDGGADGLDVIRRLVAAAAASTAAMLAIEVGVGQSAAVAAMMSAWPRVEIRPDLAGIPRVVHGWTPRS
jgi:release factor glutamine methyltransferase